MRPLGWRGESHRHYLAAKGIRTRYFSSDVKDERWTLPFQGLVSRYDKLGADKAKEKIIFSDNVIDDDSVLMVNGLIKFDLFGFGSDRDNSRRVALERYPELRDKEKRQAVIALARAGPLRAKDMLRNEEYRKAMDEYGEMLQSYWRQMVRDDVMYRLGAGYREDGSVPENQEDVSRAELSARTEVLREAVAEQIPGKDVSSFEPGRFKGLSGMYAKKRLTR